MLPIVLLKKQKVLIIGSGKACNIKLKTLQQYNYDITIVSKDFSKLDTNLSSSTKKIKKDFYSLEYDFFMPFDLIYVAIKLTNTTMVKKLAQTKMINILGDKSLSTFIHPCTKKTDKFQLSIHSLHKPNPKQICNLLKDLIKKIS